MITIKIFVPSYFRKFRCIADKCPDTCCIGWEVDIDSDTAEKYSSLISGLGEKIRRHLVKDEYGCSIFSLCDGDRCPFLNDKKLCEIHLEAGADFLSSTCSLFPRFYDHFGERCEMGIGFGCPESARIILEEKEAFSIEKYEEAESSDEIIDEDFLEKLILLREEIFSALEKKDISFRDKIFSVLALAKNFQKKLDGKGFSDENHNKTFDDCISILLDMEYINDERRELVRKIKNRSTSSLTEQYSEDFTKLMQYYIFRYFLKALYDYDVLTKVKYGIFACIVIGRIYSVFDSLTFDDRVKIMYSYSKEVEYSDLNMDVLDEMMHYDFGTEDLLKLL